MTKRKDKLHIKKIFLGVVISLLFLAACSNNNDNAANGEDSSSNELNVAYASEPTTLDNHLTTSYDTVNVTRNIYESLVTFDSDYEIQPMLAESWEESDDGKTITFDLREGVKFHNGEDLEAEDVIASMNRWLEISGEGQDKFEDAKFKELDDYTVELELDEPFSLALNLLAYDGGAKPVIMPKEIIDEAGEDDIEEYVGTGPFKFEEWEQDQYIHFSKFDDYEPVGEEEDGLSGDKEAMVDDLYFHYISDEQTRISGLQTQEYDVVESIPYDSVDQVENDETIELETAPKQMLNIYFNKKEGLFSDEDARKAIMVGINNEDLLNGAFSAPDYFELNNNIMMEHQKDQWDSQVGEDLYNKNDVDEAKDLLEDANYDGEEVSILVGTDKDYIYDGAIVLQQELEDMGINTELKAYEGATVSDKRDNEDEYDIYFKSDTPKPEPTSLLYMDSDFPGWTESSELDDVLEKMWSASDEDEAKGYYDELQEWYYNYIPIVKIGDGNNVYANQDGVENLTWMDGPIFWNVENTK